MSTNGVADNPLGIKATGGKRRVKPFPIGLVPITDQDQDKFEFALEIDGRKKAQHTRVSFLWLSLYKFLPMVLERSLKLLISTALWLITLSFVQECWHHKFWIKE
jgi:hypothetical protein